MLETDILSIVEEAFDNQIFAESFMGRFGPEDKIRGKEEFLSQVKEHLKKLFEDNDLKDTG